jgi:glycosyltransferase involved in cell wall biosynthesis
MINQFFYPDRAATAQFLTELCEDLVRDHEVTVVAGFPSYNPSFRVKAKGLLTRERYNGVAIIRPYSTSFPRQKGMIWRYINYLTFFIGSLIGCLSVRKPDLVVCMSDPPLIGLIAWITNRVKRAPFVYICQDVFPQFAVVTGNITNRRVIHVLEPLSRFMLQRSTHVVAIGEGMKKSLRTKGVPDNRMTVIHNWVDTDLIVPESKRNPFSTSYHLEDRFVVMHSGNIGANQMLGKLIEAADRLRGYGDIRFVVIGDGIAKARLVRMAEELGLSNVLFLPYQPKEMLRYSLSAADVSLVSMIDGLTGYVVPSKLYGIMASGRPVIAAVNPACETADIVREAQCGLIVKPGNVDELVEAILKFYQNRHLITTHGANGRRYVERMYSRRNAVSKYTSLFEGLVSQKGAVIDP